jgi:glycine/serine hydroxymethyltransferase
MGGNEMKKVAELIDKVIINRSNSKVISSVKSEVREMLKKFPLYKISETQTCGM